MAEKNVLKLVYPQAGGVNAVLDITKINQTAADLTKRVEWLESGSRQFALKDYSQPENQGEMVVGVYYQVAFNEANEWVPPDDHGAPSADVHHFDVYMKASDGTVSFISRQYTQANLQNVAYTNKLAVFEAGIQKATPGVFADLGANDLVAKGELDPVLAQINTDLDKVTNVIGENAENAALITVDNQFQKNQTLLGNSDGATGEQAQIAHKLKQYKHADGTFADGATTSFKAGGLYYDNAGTQLGQNMLSGNATAITNTMSVNNADASQSASIEIKFERGTGKFTATAPSTAEDAVGQEIVTADWATQKIGEIENNLQDATDTQRGFVKLSDAVNSDLDAPTGKTAATPKAVKTVNDALLAVTNVIGVNAENAALINKANVFAESQTIKGKDNTADESASLNFQASTFKNADNTFTGAQTAAKLATNLTAGDDNSVISTVEHTVDATNRGLNLAVVDDAQAHHGITITSDHAGTTTEIKLTDSTPSTAVGKEIVTADFVASKIGDLDPDHVAYINKNNQFTENQTLVGKLTGTVEDAALIGKSANYDHLAKTFDNNVTEATTVLTAQDKNAVEFGAVGVTATSTTVMAALKINDAAGTADAGWISIQRDTTSNKVRTHAPTPDIADVNKNEIVTAGFLNKALTGEEEPSPGQPTISDVLQDLKNVAYKNKENVFTETNTFQTGDATLTIGGDGIAAVDDADLVLGSGTTTLTISATGNITRPEMLPDAGDDEIVTKKYVDDKVAANATPDATTDVKGKVELATDEELKAGTDGVVPTAKQVKAALDAKIVVTSDELQATEPGVLYIIVEP